MSKPSETSSHQSNSLWSSLKNTSPATAFIVLVVVAFLICAASVTLQAVIEKKETDALEQNMRPLIDNIEENMHAVVSDAVIKIVEQENGSTVLTFEDAREDSSDTTVELPVSKVDGDVVLHSATFETSAEGTEYTLKATRYDDDGEVVQYVAYDSANGDYEVGYSGPRSGVAQRLSGGVLFNN